jgi:hypothetical protein
MNLGQKQRWSLMTVLYLVVRTTCYAIAWLAVVLTPKCSRYAILEYYILCMFLRPTSWHCANSPSLVISMSVLGMSRMHRVRLF